MTVTLELKPEVEARVIEHAATRGVPVEEFLKSVIEGSLSNRNEKAFYETATTEEWETALDEFANSPAFAKAAGRFADDSRESIYLKGKMPKFELLGRYQCPAAPRASNTPDAH